MKYLVFFLAFIVGIGLWTTKAIAQATVDPEEPIGAPTDQDMDNVSSASQPSNFNPKRPPTVGPTLIVSNPQFFSLTSPFGLLGRSETAIAVSSNGKYVVEGWNDADGFIDPSQTL